MSNLVLESLSSTNLIRRELAHGEAYRNVKSRAFVSPICPVRSPSDVTCFVKWKRPVEKKIKEIGLKGTPSQERLKGSARCKSKSVLHIKNSFWERAKLSHKQYIDVLSTRHLQSCGDIEDRKKFKSKTTSNFCSPRLIQMSCPNKRRILATWQDFGDILPAETLQRFQDMLHSYKSIDLKNARNYFKIKDRKRKRLERKQKLRRNKNSRHAFWLKEQIEETSSVIMDFFSGNPHLELSYKQLLISDTLLVLLAKISDEKEPILRYNPSLYNRQLVKMVDKMALFIDNVSKMVELQSLDDEQEEEPPKSTEAESSSIFSITESDVSERGGEREERDEVEGVEADKEMEDEEELEESDEGEGDEDVTPMSSLEKLIKILAHASPSYLGDTLEDLENLTRNEILNKIKILNKDQRDAETPAEILNKILTEWVMHNQPSEVDDRVRNKIGDVAGLITAMLAAEDLYGMMPTLPLVVDDGVEVIPGEEKLPEDPMGVSAAVDIPIDVREDDQPIPDTVTEVLSPSESEHLDVLDEDNNVNPLTMTPISDNLIPTVYDKDGKVVDKLYDKFGDQLNSTFNRFGVPEPDNYSGSLYDDENKAHELIYNDQGKIIPQCYDKDGNPIGAGYDEDGNVIFFGPDGNPISVPPGGSVRIEEGKLVIKGPDGKEILEEELGNEENVETEELETNDTEPPRMNDKEGEELEENGEGDWEYEGREEDNEGEVEEEIVLEVGEEITEEEEVIEVEEEEEEVTDVEEEEELTLAVEEEEEAIIGQEEEDTITEQSEEEPSSETEDEEEAKPEKEKEEEQTSAASSGGSIITVIPGHMIRKVYEHSNDTVCCLSLKIWTVWLLEMTHNAHNWTKWFTNIISQIREFAAILGGEIILPNGQKKVLFKNDWYKFVADMDKDVIAWRQYCRHVSDLTSQIIEKFHGKKVHCCEKCLQDHLIKNVVMAHDTMTSLTEALNCAGYWRRCLEEIVQATTKRTEIQTGVEEGSSSDGETGWSYSSSSDGDVDDYYCYTKRKKLSPSPTWKKIREFPCPCPCKLRQLFPKEEHNPLREYVTSSGY